VGGGSEEFHSFNGDDEVENQIIQNAMIPEDEESDEEDDEDEDFENEYHTEENAVGKRLKPYKALNMQQEDSTSSPVKKEQLPPIDTSSHPPRHNHHKNDLIPEIEQVINEKRSNQGSE
jgi:hypothetical protein